VFKINVANFIDKDQQLTILAYFNDDDDDDDNGMHN